MNKILFLPILIAAGFSALAQGTIFTYQGRLDFQGVPASGTYDRTFVLYGTDTGGTALAGTLTNTATAVTNGLFTVPIDFGNQYDGSPRWLEIAERTNGGGAFTTLAPRQQLTATPYAIYASSAA